MANYDDYELDEMENSAVEKSKNLKRGIVAGAAALGVGGTAAFAASAHNNVDPVDVTENEITTEDLLAGVTAGVDDTPAEESPAPQPAPQPQVVHNEVHIHYDETKPEPTPNVPEPEPKIDVEQTTALYDENGNLIGILDEGEVNGMKFMALDSDQNGKADMVAIDENMNGQFDENEFYEADNKTLDVMQGRQLVGMVRTDEGWVKAYEEENPYAPQYAQNTEHRSDDINGIHNDYLDQRTGETYRNDFAQNNTDYNNRGGEQYQAGLHDRSETPEIVVEETEEYTLTETDPAENFIAGNDIEITEAIEPAYGEQVDPTPEFETDYVASNEDYTEPVDYGYTDPSEDPTAFDASPEIYTDPTFDA